MSLIGWSQHTPESLGLSQESKQWQRNVHTTETAQMCFCLYLDKNTLKQKLQALQPLLALLAYSQSCQDLDEKLIDTTLSVYQQL